VGLLAGRTAKRSVTAVDRPCATCTKHYGSALLIESFRNTDRQYPLPMPYLLSFIPSTQPTKNSDCF